MEQTSINSYLQWLKIQLMTDGVWMSIFTNFLCDIRTGKINKYINEVFFWQKRLVKSSSLRLSSLSVFFPVLETCISSSLIKIVCKCNQIKGNDSLADFTRRGSRKVGVLFLLFQNFTTGKDWKKLYIISFGLPSKVPKTGWVKQQKLFIISWFYRLEIWSQSKQGRASLWNL